MTVVLIGPHIWGKGRDLEEAFSRLRQANGNRAVKGPVLVYVCSDAEVQVSEDSMICYAPNSTLIKLGKLPR